MPESLKRRVRKLRETLGLSQVQFAEVIRKNAPGKKGPHPSTVARWENGTSVPGGEYLQVMAKLAHEARLRDLFTD